MWTKYNYIFKLKNQILYATSIKKGLRQLFGSEKIYETVRRRNWFDYGYSDKEIKIGNYETGAFIKTEEDTIECDERQFECVSVADLIKNYYDRDGVIIGKVYKIK